MSHLIRQLLLEVIRERSWSLSAVSRRLTPSEDRSRLSKMLRGQRPFTIEDLHRVLIIIGEPEAVFWRRYLARLNLSCQTGEVDPSAILRAVAGPNPPKLPLFIHQLVEAGLPRMTQDVDLPLSKRLADLDRLRLQDRHASVEQGEKWIRECSRRLFDQRHETAQLVELITALGFWASASRTTGHSRIASLVFAFAFRLCGPMRSSLPYAYLLWRSSPVLIDGGFPSFAQTFVERAYTLYDIRGEAQSAVDVLLSLGSQASIAGRWPLARSSFERCLTQPQASMNQRATAISNLASVHDRLGAYETALSVLRDSESLLESSPPRIRTIARWLKARCLGQGSGQQQVEADQLFLAVRNDVTQYGEPLDPFLHFCDHAEVLIRMDDQERLRATAGAVAGLLPRLESTPLYEAVSQQVTCVLRGLETSIVDMRELRQQLDHTNLPDR